MSGSATSHRDAGASARETARYIAELSDGMSVLARRAGLDVIAYLLDLAKLEAEEIIQNDDLRE